MPFRSRSSFLPASWPWSRRADRTLEPLTPTTAPVGRGRGRDSQRRFDRDREFGRPRGRRRQREVRDFPDGSRRRSIPRVLRAACGPILQPLIKLDGASAPFSNYASVAEPPLADWLGYLMKFDYAKIASPKQATS